MRKYDALRREVEARFRAGEHLSYHVFIEGGMAKKWAHRAMQRLHKDKQVHIHHHKRNTDGPATPFYAWGEGRDAPKLRRMTPAELGRRYRRNNPDMYVKDIERMRGKRLLARPPTFDPLTRALMGV